VSATIATFILDLNMLKALLLDMDETLCDTHKANENAKLLMARYTEPVCGDEFDGGRFAEGYVAGIYRHWSDEQRERYQVIIDQQGEAVFRIKLIQDLVAQQNNKIIDELTAKQWQDNFDRDRLDAFDFYPGIVDFLKQARKLFTLVVITNGPEFSQIPKIKAVNLTEYVDHILIGGQEPEQKPARSIFDKALRLAGCEAHEAIHVGDNLFADIQGANNAGVTSVWVQHQQPLDAELGISPHHTVMHPSELPALLQNIQRPI
jgi:HAD superfamily hydrolase (TIGR01549 family)